MNHMKKFSVFFLGMIMLAMTIACGPTTNATNAQPQKEGYNIKVTVENTTSNQAYLAYYYGNKQYIKDTTDLVNGSFTFKGDTSL